MECFRKRSWRRYSTDCGLMETLIRTLVTRLVKLFYARLEVQYPERLHCSGPAIYVLNHPNGLLDPAVLMTVLNRSVVFWSKSTLFAIPLVAWLASKWGAVPVFRKADIGLRGGAANTEDMARSNEHTFACCRALLHSGGALALFPEGLTHAEPYLFPLRTGAARLALQTEAEAGWRGEVTIVPVGLWYENSTRFRTSVLISAGEPLTVEGYSEEYGEEASQAVRRLTDQIATRLRAVVLEAESSELMRMVPTVAAWTVPRNAEPDLTAQHAWASKLLAAYQTLQRRDPARLDSITQEAWEFFSLLRSSGITIPWGIETPRIRWCAVGFTVLRLVIFAVPALVGYMLSIVPYRVSGTVVRTMFPYDRTLVGTAKLLCGTVFSIVVWLLMAVVMSLLTAPFWGISLALVSPFCAYVAMRWAEWRKSAGEIWRIGRLRKRRADLASVLTARRAALARSVREAVRSVG